MSTPPKQKPSPKYVDYDGNQRVSSCGNYIYMSNGAKFKRTVLRSSADPPSLQTEEDILLDEYNNETESNA